MTADEIRKVHVYGGNAATVEITEMLREIAAQLAELNSTVGVVGGTALSTLDRMTALAGRIASKP